MFADMFHRLTASRRRLPPIISPCETAIAAVCAGVRVPRNVARSDTRVPPSTAEHEQNKTDSFFPAVNSGVRLNDRGAVPQHLRFIVFKSHVFAHFG